MTEVQFFFLADGERVQPGGLNMLWATTQPSLGRQQRWGGGHDLCLPHSNCHVLSSNLQLDLLSVTIQLPSVTL